MKRLITNYTFDKTAKTVTFSDYPSIALHRVLLITNVTDGIIIYNFADPSLGGTVSGNVITLTYDTSTMSNADALQVYYDDDTTGIPDDGDDAMVITARPQSVDRISFAKAVANNVDAEWGALVGSIGTGIGVNQTGGNLVITSGTTARSELILRSAASFKGGIRLRAKTTLSQRIVNNNFFVELVDVIGDGLAYTINSATQITVTIPNNPFTSANVGQSMYLGGFAGTGTFLSGRYPIASVSGNDVVFTVSAFAAGSGTVSAFGWNYYHVLYDSTTATNAKYDTQRRGYATGDTTATIATTATGHLAIVTGNDMSSVLSDQPLASSATVRTTLRASRDENVPDDVELRLQVRVANGSTNPASTTTWTIGYLGVSNYSAQDVVVQDTRQTTNSPIPIDILRAVTLAVSGSLTSAGTTTATPATGTTYNLVTTASNNLAFIKNAAGNLYEITVSNPTATAAYVKLYNKASAPVVASDVPVMTIAIPATAAGVGEKSINFGAIGKRFATGIAIAVVGAAVATDATNTVAGIQVNATYI
jgi:hypothetical protein